MVKLDEIASYLDMRLSASQFEEDQNGILRPAKRSIARIGLTLVPWEGLQQWVAVNELDAVFLHRPWMLQPEQIPTDVGILAYHLTFDEYLTLGYNTRLADLLCITGLEIIGDRDGRPLGMIGSVRPHSFVLLQGIIKQIFGGVDETFGIPQREIKRIAVVGAMTEELIYEAASRNVDAYITGQFRKMAAPAVIDTGINVVIVGHQRSEQWGLRALAHLLSERWEALKVVVNLEKAS